MCAADPKHHLGFVILIFIYFFLVMRISSAKSVDPIAAEAAFLLTFSSVWTGMRLVTTAVRQRCLL